MKQSRIDKQLYVPNRIDGEDDKELENICAYLTLYGNGVWFGFNWIEIRESKSSLFYARETIQQYYSTIQEVTHKMKMVPVLFLYQRVLPFDFLVFHFWPFKWKGLLIVPVLLLYQHFLPSSFLFVHFWPF